MARSIVIRLAVQDDYSAALSRYNQQMGEAERQTKQAGGAGEKTASQWDQLKTAAAGFISLGLAKKVVDIGLGLNQLGREINATNVQFTELAGGRREATELMSDMADATGHAVDNMTLMTSASQLMNLGLTSSSAQTVDLIDKIVALKKPVDSAADAVDNFSLLLANQSYLRLDSFGINSGRVRKRVEELGDEFENLTKEQKFTQAVMEEMERKIVALGPAATVAETALGRLETRFENFRQQMAANINMGVEGAMGFLDVFLGTHPALQQREEDTKRAITELTQYAMETLPNQLDISSMPPNFMESYLHAAVEVAIRSPQLAADKQRLQEAALALMNPDDKVVFPGTTPEMFASMTGTMAEMAQFVGQNNSQIMTMLDREEEAVEHARELAELRERAASAVPEYMRYYDWALDRQGQLNRLEEEQARTRDSMFGSLRSQASSVLGALGASPESLQYGDVFSQIGMLGSGMTDMPRFMDQGQADEIARAADMAKTLFDNMKEADKANDSLFTDQQLNIAELQAQHMGSIADNAQKAASALQNLSLEDVFGQGAQNPSDNLLGQMTDQLMTAAEEAGYTKDQLDALQDALDRQSNQETTGSQAIDNVIAPMVADIGLQLGPEAAATAGQNISDFLYEATRQGIDTNSAEFLALLPQALGVSFNEDGTAKQNMFGFDPAPLLETLAQAQDETQPMSENMAAMGDTAPIIADDTGRMAENLITAASEASKMKDELLAMSSKTTTIKVKTEWTNKEPFLDALFADFTKRVQANGGNVPGSSNAATSSAGI